MTSSFGIRYSTQNLQPQIILNCKFVFICAGKKVESKAAYSQSQLTTFVPRRNFFFLYFSVLFESSKKDKVSFSQQLLIAPSLDLMPLLPLLNKHFNDPRSVQ